MTAPRRLLFVSNGHGEDAIAAGIIRQLPPGFSAEAYPTLGRGTSYDGVCPVVGPRAELPSEGWRNVRFSVLRDFAGGLLPTLLPGLGFFRHAARAYDRVIVVGDMIGVYGCLLGGVRNILYLDVYKTGFSSGYLAPDVLALKATARRVFCRAERLAAQLRGAGLDARAAGNVMMDTIPRGAYDPALRRSHPLALAILPGSRTHALRNFALQTAALSQLNPELMPDLFLPVAGSLSVSDLAAAAGGTVLPRTSNDGEDLGVLQAGSLRIHLVAGSALGNVIEAVDLVLSQAGTASVQAIGLGRPVVTFQSPADRHRRFRDEQRLFGDARRVVPASPEQIADALDGLLRNHAERERMGAVGRAGIGGPGVIAEILASL